LPLILNEGHGRRVLTLSGDDDPDGAFPNLNLVQLA
jgi:hypothetical protein